MTIVLGADAGGTRTTAAIWRDGVELARAEGAAGAIRPGRSVAAAAQIAETVRGALARAGRARGDILVVGAAGAGREPERQELRGALRGHDLSGQLVVTTDVDLALAAAFGAGPGVVLLAGTGSIAIARRPDGTLARAGGHGWQAGDEGGGYWIGRQALAAIMRGIDGRGPPTRLFESIAPIARAASPADLVRWSVTAAPTEVAALASGVLAAARAGDDAASTILRAAADELAMLVVLLARGHGSPARVATGGGLLTAGSPLKALLDERLARQGGLAVEGEAIDPVTGALHLAGG